MCQNILKKVNKNFKHNSTHAYVQKIKANKKNKIFKNNGKHEYVQVVVIVAHIFLWFYVQKRLKRLLWVEDMFPI